ncbi:glycosyltransferase [Ensifer sp. SL37]|uniref:glycosyltransferase n=1 Tax=Ensifer sp. SL37 TaxID=2995137 RepID=UPI002276EEDE|nr:glycosyltransferase [Ensifer sp. SL37]MCY1740370.1 glycosyltransferase [Ensifer sp. SL37]
MIKLLQKVHHRNKVIGFIDHHQNDVLFGWLADKRDRRLRIEFDLFVRDEYLGHFATGFARPDLAKFHIGDGFNGFRVPVCTKNQAELVDELKIIVRGRTLVPRSQSDGVYKLVDVGPCSTEQLLTAMSNGISNLSNRLSRSNRFDHILSRSSGQLAEFPTSVFTHHLREKYSDIGTTDRTGFYRWYLEEYIARRPSNFMAVLSPEEENALFCPVPNAEGFPVPLYATSVARNQPHTVQVNSKRRVALAYWWNIIERGRLRLAESCAFRDYDAILKESVEPEPTQFPLNCYLQSLWTRNHRNTWRDLFDKKNQRRAAYFYALLIATRSPYLLNYIPPFDFASVVKNPESHDALRRWVEIERSREQNAVGDCTPNHFCDAALPQIKNENAIQMIAPFSSVSGLGETARRFAGALTGAGVKCRFVAYNQRNGATYCDVDFPLGDLSPSAINIIQLNLDQVPEFFIENKEILQSGYNIVVPFWELNAPANCHHAGLALADELWVSSRYIQEAFSPSGTLNHYIGHPARRILMNQVSGRLVSHSSPFRFLLVFDALSWMSRKNPLGVVEAFQSAFSTEDPVELVIKTQNASLLRPGMMRDYWLELLQRTEFDSRIHLYQHTLSDAEQRSLISEADCLVSLHRSEGLGVDLLDCLYSGIPVIATNYSGNVDFCKPNNSWLVDYSLVKVDVSHYPYVHDGHTWAEPDQRDAIHQMQSVFRDAEMRAKKATKATLDISERYAPEVVGKRMAGRLDQIFNRIDAHISL